MLTLSYASVSEFFPTASELGKCALYDNTYWCPKMPWIDEWWRLVKYDINWTPPKASRLARLFGAKLFVYDKMNDCDNFSLRALVMAQKLFSYTPSGKTGGAMSPAVFEVAGHLLGSQHAMNAVIQDVDGSPCLWLVEPQDANLLLRNPRNGERVAIQNVRG